ncbi:unnamed protein product, partial [Symbiodinium microadriaticum]
PAQALVAKSAAVKLPSIKGRPVGPTQTGDDSPFAPLRARTRRKSEGMSPEDDSPQGGKERTTTVHLDEQEKLAYVKKSGFDGKKHASGNIFLPEQNPEINLRCARERQTHLHLRTRSKVRLQLRLGLPVGRRKRLVVDTHHSAPRHPSMGRGGRAQQERAQAEWAREWADPQSVRYWRGSWGRRDSAQETSFPRYDSTAWPATEQSTKGKGKQQGSWDRETSPGGQLVPDMQELLNHTRPMWRRSKKAYLEESQRHNKDLQRVTEDLAKAIAAQDEARERIRVMAYYLSEGIPPPVSGPQEDTSWEDMMEQMQMERDQDGPRAVLERAMAAGREQKGGPVPMQTEPEGGRTHPLPTAAPASTPHFGAACPSTPPQRTAGPEASTPPGTDKPTYTKIPTRTTRTSEPYLASPENTAAGACGTHAGVGNSPDHMRHPEPRQAEAPIGPPSDGGLAGKLAAKRAGTALKPFGTKAPKKAGAETVHQSKETHPVPVHHIPDGEEAAEGPDFLREPSPGDPETSGYQTPKAPNICIGGSGTEAKVSDPALTRPLHCLRLGLPPRWGLCDDQSSCTRCPVAGGQVAILFDLTRVDPSCTLMCSFPIKDLEVQGELSTFVIAVAEVPSPAMTGVKPHFLLLHYPSVHLPAVIALLGLSTPAAMRIGVHGGEREGDDIRIRGNTTLRLFAEERPVPTTPEDTSESSSSEQVEVRFSSDTSPARGPLYGQAPEGRLDVECDLAVGYANWGEQPDLPPLSASLLDSTLPAGHSWNIGAEEDEHPAPDNETEPPVPADQDMEAERPAAAPSTLLNALVYIPDYVPEVLEVRVDLPIGIRDFVDVVQQLRFADQIAGFPHLCPVTPQPLCEMAIFVAAPTWLTDLVVVLMDCRLTQSGLFARTVHSRLNRESILVAAGFRHDDAISVHIEGRIRPLGIDERVALTHGHTIHFVPRYTDVPRCFELADMLLTSQGWDPEAPMPGIQSHLNSHFLILSDAGPFTLAITPRSFVDFKGVVAEAVGVAEHRLYTKVSVPQIKECFAAFGAAASTRGSGGLDRAREATRLLGGPWPFPPYRWPILVQEEEADPMDVDTDERFMVDISVYLLTPDYTAEHLPLTVQLPQTLQEIEELVQTCREADRRALFPTLIEVRPQPDPGWGIFLAVPAWASQRAVICCDLSFFDGRIIAVSVPPLTDSFSLCASVGLAPRAEVDIFLPGAAAPLPPGGEVFLQSGTCVAFVRPGQILVVAFAPDGPPQGRQLTSSEDTQQTVFCPAIQVPGATRGTVDLCHRLFLALAFVTVALPVLLQGDLGLSMLACGSFLVHRHRFPAVFLYAFACGSATTGDTAMAVQIGAKYGAPIEVRQAGEISGDPTSCAVHPVGELDIGQRLRTIATPCRASVPGPVMIDDHPAEDELPFSFAMDSLVTLLEESAWDTESRVFFEASTLLEVLFEHFGDPVVAGECENKFPPAGPPTLLLSEHFTGPPCHDVSSVALRLDTGATGALQVFTDGSFDGFSCLFGWNEGETMAPICRAAMQALLAGRPTVKSQVEATLRPEKWPVQEARSSVDTTYVSDTHVRTQAFFHPNDFLTVASGPRELLVRFSRAGTQILFICIHAPVGGSPEREKWWKELRHRIRRFSRNALVFLAGDFNTGFHYKIPLRVGDLVWSSAHGAPAGLEGILADQDLWIPSTFSQCHTGNHDTWLSPSGTTGARLDYFAVAASWFVPDNNSWVDTSLAEDVWIRHFAGIEDGEKIDPLQLVENCHLFQSEKDLDAYELTTGSLPTRTELEQSLRSTQTNRAIGLDRVPGELLHFAAGQVSVPLFQLFLKVSMRAAEPIQFKGGALFAIWKGTSFCDEAVAQVKQAGHLPVVPWSEGMLCSLQPVEPGLHTKEALDATWMDDATFLVVADTAAALPGAMATTGKAVLDACVSRALLPNVDRGKTELIAHVVGAGSRGVRKDLFSLPDASLAIPCKLWEGASIRLVPTYQHLGGFIHHDASLVRELRLKGRYCHMEQEHGVSTLTDLRLRNHAEHICSKSSVRNRRLDTGGRSGSMARSFSHLQTASLHHLQGCFTHP